MINADTNFIKFNYNEQNHKIELHYLWRSISSYSLFGIKQSK